VLGFKLAWLTIVVVAVTLNCANVVRCIAADARS
jgi:hypothetical protein